MFFREKVADISSNTAHLKPLISLLSHINKLYTHRQHTPIFMARTRVYKSIVDTCVINQK